MEGTSKPGTSDKDAASQVAASVDSVLAMRVSEAPPPAKPKATEHPEDKSGKALEWTKVVAMPLVTVIITALGGYFFTSLTKDREERESNERLYAQLLTQREQSDALIRKDMFGVVINRFLEDAKKGDWNNKILQLELLANNFNQALDLAPLFKEVARSLPLAAGLPRVQAIELKKRLDRTAATVIFKQVNSLSRRGFVADKSVPLAGWESSIGKPFIDATIPMARLVPSTVNAPIGDKDRVHFSVELVDVSIDRREVDVRVRADFSRKDDQDVDRHFWVGQYDFPMLDNTQLPHGLRLAVVITEFFVPEVKEEREANSFVKFHLIVFPAASASFKERQDYDDILLDILRTKNKSIGSEGEQP